MSTATANPMEAAVQKLVEQGASLATAMETVQKTLQQPDLSGLKRYDNDGRMVASWEETDESMELAIGSGDRFRNATRQKSFRSQKKDNRRLLKSLGYQPWGEFKTLGDVVRTGFEKGGGPAFESRLTKHLDKVLGHYKTIQGMGTSVGADGGFTVLPEFAPGIIDRVYDNPLWGMTDNYTVNGNNMTFLANAETNRANGSRHGGLRGYWVGEGGTITSSKPTFREVTLKLHKLAAVVYLTQELIDDGGFALEQYITRKAAEEFNFMIGDALINGSGVGQPLGIMNSPSLVSVSKESGQGAATILPENVEKMYSRFYAPNLGNMRWLHNQDIGSALNLMTLGIGAGGVSLFMPPGGMSEAPYGTLKGRPLQPTEFNATLGTTGDLLAADLGQILSISKSGIAQAVSMHLEFLTDQLALRFTMRLNAQSWENAPITPYKGTSNTQSNFVSLATRG